MTISEFKRRLLEESKETFNYNLGNAALVLGRYEEAIDLYRRGLKVTDQFSPQYFAYSFALQHLGNEDQAAEARRLGNALDPFGEVTALIDLAQVHTIQGDKPAAVTKLQAALTLRPDLADIRLDVGKKLLDLDRTNEAFEQLNILLESKTGDASLFKRLAGMFRGQGKWAEAQASFARANALDPSDTSSRDQKIVCLFFMSRFEDAERELKKLAELDAGNRAFVILTLLAQKKFAQIQEIEKLLQDGFDAGQDKILLLYTLALVQICIGNVSDAENTVSMLMNDDAARKTGHYPNIVNYFGLVRQRQGRHAEAIEFHNRAIALAPTEGFLHIDLGLALTGLGKHSEALAEYRTALQLCQKSKHPIKFRLSLRPWAEKDLFAIYRDLGVEI